MSARDWSTAPLLRGGALDLHLRRHPFLLTVDGETLDPKGPALNGGARAKKVFVYRFRSMRPGTYQFVGRWRWNGVIVQTTVLTVVVD